MSTDSDTGADMGAPAGGRHTRLPGVGAPGAVPAQPGVPTYDVVRRASTDILASYDVEDTPRRAPWLLVCAVGALVLALVGGVTYGFRSLSGGGAQPEDALPAGAFAFGEIDLDPGAGQKLDAFRFLRQFPALRDKLTGDDLRKAVFEAVAEDAGWGDIDFDSQVAPWLGQRLAVAAYPRDRFGAAPADTGASPMPGSPQVPTAVLALQVTDEGAARAGLARLVESAGGSPGDVGGATRGSRPSVGFVVDGDYALLAETTAIAEKALAAAGEGSLATDADFAADMAQLGDGVASAWVDMSAAGALAGLANPLALGAVGNLAGVSTATGATGRAAYVLRFDGPDALEVAGRFTDAEQLAGTGTARVTGMDALPASSVVALGLGGGEDLVGAMWAGLRSQVEAMGGEDFDEGVADAESALGIDLPEDLQTLLGSNLLGALDGRALAEGRFEVGARVTTDPERARPLLATLTALAREAEPGVRSQVTDEGYLLASSPGMLRRLGESGEATLAGNEAFSRALPDLADARMAVWVDVKPLVTGVTGLWGAEPRTDPNLERLAGFGMTVSTAEDGSGGFRMRLVTR